jgi:hypothetical protein
VDLEVILTFHLIVLQLFIGFYWVLQNLKLLGINFVHFSSFFKPGGKILTFSHLVIFLVTLSPLKNNFLQVIANFLFFLGLKYDFLSLALSKINYFQWNEVSKNLQRNILLNFHHQ